MKNFISALWEWNKDFINHAFSEAGDGIREHNWKRIVWNLFKLLAYGGVICYFWEYIITAIVVAVIIYAFCSAKPKQVPPPPSPPTFPTQYDYFSVMAVLRCALKEIAPALGLSAVYDDSDLAVEPDEQILPWGDWWYMKYRTLKKAADASVNTQRMEEALQKQIRIVLLKENPTGYANVDTIYKGKSEPIVQVVKVKAPQGAVYVSILLTYASDEYFQQRDNWKKRGETPLDEADPSDTDF